MSQDARCAACGMALVAGSPGGLCPRCMLQRGLETNTLMSANPSAASASWLPPSPQALALQFPELDILELIGRGGMGAVYKARQKNLDRLVALKILPPQLSSDPAFAERFAREAQAMARLSHPHIVPVYEFGQRDTLYFFIMEFMDGLNLRQLMTAGTIAPKEALAIVPQICEALQYAHDQGIVHRDIKPENILLNKQGQVKIADFGLAKLMGRTADAEKVMGTPQYMAPEQIERPAEVDHRADIYSLGVVFYQMLTGELPVGKFAVPSKKVQVDVRLDEVVLKALEREPEKRYQQVSEVKTEVETLVGPPASSQVARPVPAWHHALALTGTRNGVPVVNVSGVICQFLIMLAATMLGAHLKNMIAGTPADLMTIVGPLMLTCAIIGIATALRFRRPPDQLTPLDAPAEGRNRASAAPSTSLRRPDGRLLRSVIVTPCVHAAIFAGLCILFATVVPRFDAYFKEGQMPLTPAAAWMVHASYLVQHFFWTIILPTAIALIVLDGLICWAFLRFGFKRLERAWSLLVVLGLGSVGVFAAYTLHEPTFGLSPMERDAIIRRENLRNIPAPAFGPVIETVLRVPKAPDFIWTNLDTAKDYASGEFLKDADGAKAALQWNLRIGARVSAELGPHPGVRTLGTRLEIVDNRFWQATPEEIQQLLLEKLPYPRLTDLDSPEEVPYFMTAEVPWTCIYRTPHGAGLLQMLGLSDDKNGIRIRIRPLVAPALRLDLPASTRAEVELAGRWDSTDPLIEGIKHLELALDHTCNGIIEMHNKPPHEFTGTWRIEGDALFLAETSAENTPPKLLHYEVSQSQGDFKLLLQGPNDGWIWFAKTASPVPTLSTRSLSSRKLAVDSAPSFGPIIETVLPYTRAPDFIWTNLNTGQGFSAKDLPKGADINDQGEGLKWRLKTGAEAGVEIRPTNTGIVTFDTRTSVIDNTYWDSPASEIQRLVQALPPLAPNRVEPAFITAPDFPVTFVFQTRQGAGIVQILGISDASRPGLRVRIRPLVDSPASRPAGTPALTAAERNLVGRWELTKSEGSTANTRAIYVFSEDHRVTGIVEDADHPPEEGAGNWSLVEETYLRVTLDTHPNDAVPLIRVELKEDTFIMHGQGWTETFRRVPKSPPVTTTGPAATTDETGPFHNAYIPRHQMLRAQTALASLRSRLNAVENAAPTGRPAKDADVPTLKSQIATLDAAYSKLERQWNKMEALITRMKAAGKTTDPDFTTTLRDTNTAEAQLRMVQAVIENDLGQLRWGAVIETQVPYNDVAPWPWFDIDNNHVELLPEDDGPHGADFLAINPAQRPTRRPELTPASETGFGSVALEPTMWDSLSPSQLAEKLCSATVTELDTGGGLPSTYGFTTRAGGIGILQILAADDHGVRIRYKLVALTVAPAAQTGPATPLGSLSPRGQAPPPLSDAEAALVGRWESTKIEGDPGIKHVVVTFSPDHKATCISEQSSGPPDETSEEWAIVQGSYLRIFNSKDPKDVPELDRIELNGDTLVIRDDDTVITLHRAPGTTGKGEISPGTRPAGGPATRPGVPGAQSSAGPSPGNGGSRASPKETGALFTSDGGRVRMASNGVQIEADRISLEANRVEVSGRRGGDGTASRASP